MICNLCGTQEATIHLTEIVNDQMVEIHLCETCAQEKGTDFKTHFNISDLLTGIDEGAISKPAEKTSARKCPSCGISYDEFGKTGRLGCPDCYKAFDKLLLPLIRRVQRSNHHVGKKPSKLSGSGRRAHDLRILQSKLSRCVQSEEFEEAARLRDEIRQVELNMKESKKKK